MADQKTSQHKKSDRLQVMERIDARMNPRRRRQEPTTWEIKGELFLNCTCEVWCPCVISLGKHPPTEGYCKAWMAIRIDEGNFEGEDLSGLNVALLVDIPGKMAEGGWRVAAYVDERATQKAYNGLLKILSGGAGGSTGLLTMLVSDIIGAERAPVEIGTNGSRRTIKVGRKIEGEIEMLGGLDPENPVMITNSSYWMGSTIIPAVGLRSKLRDYGRVWDLSSKSADICPIHWSGPGRPKRK